MKDDSWLLHSTESQSAIFTLTNMWVKAYKRCNFHLSRSLWTLLNLRVSSVAILCNPCGADWACEHHCVNAWISRSSLLVFLPRKRKSWMRRWRWNKESEIFSGPWALSLCSPKPAPGTPSPRHKTSGSLFHSGSRSSVWCGHPWTSFESPVDQMIKLLLFYYPS